MSVIDETIELWEQEPEKAAVAPRVVARFDGDGPVTLESGAFTWQTDLPPPLGGGNTAASPTAQLLGALAGCAVVFITDTLAPQLGIQVDSVSAAASCKADFRGLLGMGGVAPDIGDLELAIEISSPDSANRVEELYRVWLERCPVYLALTKPTSISTTLSAS